MSAAVYRRPQTRELPVKVGREKFRHLLFLVMQFYKRELESAFYESSAETPSPGMTSMTHRVRWM